MSEQPTFRAVVAQAVEDIGADPLHFLTLPRALKHRLGQAGYVIRAVLPPNIGDVGRPLEPDLHSQHHPAQRDDCWACDTMEVGE